MKLVEYYHFLRGQAIFANVRNLHHDQEYEVNEWVILQNLPNESLGEGNDWIDRALIHIESVEWDANGKPKINMEGYEFVNLLEHFEYGTPIEGGDKFLKRFSRALERGDVHHQLSKGQLAIELNNLVVANDIEVDWPYIVESSYTWNNLHWRIKRLNDPQMLPFMCSINYRLIL